MSEIKFREFDEERIKRELEASLPALRRELEALEAAKRVSARAMRYMVTI